MISAAAGGKNGCFSKKIGVFGMEPAYRPFWKFWKIFAKKSAYRPDDMVVNPCNRLFGRLEGRQKSGTEFSLRAIIGAGKLCL